MKGKIKGKIPGALVYMTVTALLGGLIWFIGELFFDTLTEDIFTPVGITLYFLMALFMLSAVLLILLRKKMSSATFKSKMHSTWKAFLVALLIFALITGVFEFLYEFGNTETPEPTSLIFLIDDSGSMEGNESDRIKALNDVMKSSDIPFAVYSFTENAKLLRDTALYSNELTEQDIAFASSGGTEIIGSINDVLNDLTNGTVKDAGNYPKILLVSDGGSYSFGLRSMTKACRKQNVSVSSIGMEGSYEPILEKIAEKTGGVYVRCTDVKSLGSVLSAAVASETDRNLLSERVVYKNNALYAVLRIFFLSVMGVVWSAIKAMLLSEKQKILKRAFMASCILCTAATFILEFGAAVDVPLILLRLLFVVMWTVTFGTMSGDRITDPATSSDIPIDPGVLTVDPHIIPDVSTLSRKEDKEGVKMLDTATGEDSKSGGGLFAGNRSGNNGTFGSNHSHGGGFGGNQGANGGSGLFGN